VVVIDLNYARLVENYFITKQNVVGVVLVAELMLVKQTVINHLKKRG